MYKIELTNSPNQTFQSIIPVNGGNIDFTFYLSYNDQAGYWSLTLTNTLTQELYFSNLPLLSSFSEYTNMIFQLDYKMIGSIYIAYIQNIQNASMPDDKNIGKDYIMVWGDNE